MFVSSNPLAIAAILSLATALVYEWRYDFLLAVNWLAIQALNLLLLLWLFWWIPALMGVCYAIDRWLGWQWLLVGIARAWGGCFVLVFVWVLWVEVLRPWVQKLSRRLRAARP